MHHILEEVLLPMQKKNVVVLVGRFSPPHLGHYKAINNAKAFIRNNPKLNLEAQPVVIVIAGPKTSLDKKTNPLSVHDRINFMKYSGNADGVVFSESSNAFKAFEKVRELGYEPIVIAAGDDRADNYLSILDNHFLKKNGSKISHYKVPNLEREKASLSDLEDSATIDSSLVSGTMVRAAINAGYEDVFTKMVGLEKKPKLAKLMFKKVKKAMEE